MGITVRCEGTADYTQRGDPLRSALNIVMTRRVCAPHSGPTAPTGNRQPSIMWPPGYRSPAKRRAPNANRGHPKTAGAHPSSAANLHADRVCARRLKSRGNPVEVLWINDACPGSEKSPTTECFQRVNRDLSRTAKDIDRSHVIDTRSVAPSKKLIVTNDLARMRRRATTSPSSSASCASPALRMWSLRGPRLRHGAERREGQRQELRGLSWHFAAHCAAHDG